MAKAPVIKDLRNFIESKLDGATVDNAIEIKYLTEPGDNYGSTMLKISIEVSEASDNTNKKSKQSKRMELVGKMPPTNEMILAIFQIPITFIKETALYDIIAPTMINFQKEIGILDEQLKLNVFCHCFGTRLSLIPDSKIVDADALIILENLKHEGYYTENRVTGCCSDNIKTILRNLANFHAVGIALRLLKPELFDKNLQPYLQRINIDAAMSEDSMKHMLNALFADIKTIKSIAKNVEKIKKQVYNCLEKQKDVDRLLEENQFSTMIHNDFWVNNIMVKKNDDADGVGNYVKIVDFQIISMESCLKDVLFFLMTSIPYDDLNTKFDSYIKYYHESLHRHLKQFYAYRKEFPIDKFTYEKYLAEMNRVAPIELYHIVSMLKIVLANKEAIPDFADMNEDFFSQDNLVGPNYFERMEKVIQIYLDKGWL